MRGHASATTTVQHASGARRWCRFIGAAVDEGRESHGVQLLLALRLSVQHTPE